MASFDVTERPVILLGWDTSRTVYPTGIASGAAVGTAQANATVLPDGAASAGSVGSAATTASVTAVGIDAASGAVGSPSLLASLAPSGIAGTADTGSPKGNASAPVSGIGSSAALGDATAFTSMGPSGIDAATGSVGSPSLNLVMSPSGISGTEQFGDADTLATVFIIPGPFDPSNDFGDPVVTKRGWVFRPPTITLGWRFQKRYEGVSLLKEDGVWNEVSHPDMPRTLAAEKYLAGGHDHVVSDSLKAELIAAGYTVTDEVVTTEEYKS